VQKSPSKKRFQPALASAESFSFGRSLFSACPSRSTSISDQIRAVTWWMTLPREIVFAIVASGYRYPGDPRASP
jgi:hypothetical protein